MPRPPLPPPAKTGFNKGIRIKMTADFSVGTLGTGKQWNIAFNFEEYFQGRIGVPEY